ncbi:hypothetical protein mRhiFer1_008469 [Rhinolophus ferrumequinum]|uniref:Uncharacterized protein n=1 Tax=Rhinolophus ferrumequinum TaxID=59479 RepID=A0A7J7V8C1_RHIFE|nr:hypothetical protein mRhiFer1_008469 [Rhinolophus ferrumequinum]
MAKLKRIRERKERPAFQGINTTFLSGDHLASLLHQLPYEITEPSMELALEKELDHFISSQSIWTCTTAQQGGAMPVITQSPPRPSSQNCQTPSLHQTSPAPQLPNPADRNRADVLVSCMADF